MQREGWGVRRGVWVRLTAAVGLLGVLAWVVKWAALGVQGGQETGVDRTAFVVGLVLLAVGSVSVALRATSGRGTAMTVVAVLIAVVVTVLLVPALSIASNAVFGEGTRPGTEGGLVVLALVALVAGVTGLRVPRPTPVAARTGG